MNYDDYEALKKEEAVYREMLQYTEKLKQLVSTIEDSRELRYEIQNLHRRILLGVYNAR